MKHILQIWRSFFKEKLEELGIREDVDTDSLVKGSGDERKAGKVCRKCFSALERYEKIPRSIEKSIEDVLEAMVPNLEVPSPKRCWKVHLPVDHCLPALVSLEVVNH